MSELKDIVPPIGLCELIPVGEFEESALVWKRREIFFRGIDIRDRNDSVTFRGDEQKDTVSEDDSIRYYPAPTLEEVLDVLVDFGASFCCNGMAVGNELHKYPICAKEALLLWLKVRGNE